MRCEPQGFGTSSLIFHQLYLKMLRVCPFFQKTLLDCSVLRCSTMTEARPVPQPATYKQ